MRKPLVAGNWKMNGSKRSITGLLDELKAGFTGLSSQLDVAVFPPSVYLGQVADCLAGTGVVWGLQNISHQSAGAFTGELSAAMASDFCAQMVLVGHSERRSLYGENDRDVGLKVQAAIAAGLAPVLCVGESLQEREAGLTDQTVCSQVQAVLDAVNLDPSSRLIIAYEPVWAIGTGRTASPEQAQEVHAAIRHLLASQDSALAQATRILYGGSVSAANAQALFGQPDIDGGLVGGASLKAADFISICRAVS